MKMKRNKIKGGAKMAKKLVVNPECSSPEERAGWISGLGFVSADGKTFSVCTVVSFDDVEEGAIKVPIQELNPQELSEEMKSIVEALKKR